MRNRKWKLNAAAITSALNVSLKAPSQMLDRALSTCPVRRGGICLPSEYSQPHSHRTNYAKIHFRGTSGQANPAESPFAALMLRTAAVRRYGRVDRTTTVIRKMQMGAGSVDRRTPSC